MSYTTYEDDCPDCRPAILDTKSGKALPDDHPIMRIVARVWAETTREERRAFHAVACSKSRTDADMALAAGIAERIAKAMRS